MVKANAKFQEIFKSDLECRKFLKWASPLLRPMPQREAVNFQEWYEVMGVTDVPMEWWNYREENERVEWQICTLKVGEFPLPMIIIRIDQTNQEPNRTLVHDNLYSFVGI